MLRDTDEEFHQMEIEEMFQKEIKGNLFAVSKIFADARKQMNLAEYKTLTLALTNVKWTEECPEVLYMDKKELAEIIGVHSDPDHLSQDLKRSIGEIPIHSFIKFEDKDKDFYINGCFISSIGFYKNRVRLKMNTDYLSLFGNLDKNYITMWSEDIYGMGSERSVEFYELLRMNSDTRLDVNEGTVGIKKLKELFNIPKEGKGSYMRSEKNGGFNRSEFEKKVIDPLCEDLAKTRMIQLIVQPDGKYYEKVKKGNRVIAYKFQWTITNRPQIVSAPELKELKEDIEKNSEVLKIAKDIVKGKKKAKGKGFGDYTQTTTDETLDEFEKMFLKETNS